MTVSKRKQKILELEAELRIINNIFYIRGERGDGTHARHNKYLLRAAEIRKELEEISLKWKIKKFLRRFDK
jgi:hypothetical protein